MKLKIEGFDEKEVKGYLKALEKLVNSIDKHAEKVVKKRVDKDNKESYAIGLLTSKTSLIMYAIHCLTFQYVTTLKEISKELEELEGGGDEED